jgi:hypothetical protein
MPPPGRANARAADPGVAAAHQSNNATRYSPARQRRQIPPRERHDPIADDKRSLFEVAPVHRLAGVWQGPGTIAELRRGRP